jgi:ribonuclease III
LSRPAALEKRLGHRFKDARLLEQALTHRSHGVDNNERLEFLGDGVLGCAVAEELYTRFPGLPEGKLTRLRASLVREDALAEVAEQLQLAGFLHVGPKQQVTRSLLADAVEALVGAIFVDAGYAAARNSVLAAVAPLIDRLDPDKSAKDAKTELQEMLQAKHLPLPQYRVTSVQGQAHRQSFEVECSIAEPALVSIGTGTSRQRAEQQAAIAMLEKLAK